MKTAIILLYALSVCGCATMTPMQKKVVTVIVVGSIAATVAAHGGGHVVNAPNDPQHACGCVPPPRVK